MSGKRLLLRAFTIWFPFAYLGGLVAEQPEKLIFPEHVGMCNTLRFHSAPQPGQMRTSGHTSEQMFLGQFQPSSSPGCTFTLSIISRLLVRSSGLISPLSRRADTNSCSLDLNGKSGSTSFLHSATRFSTNSCCSPPPSASTILRTGFNFSFSSFKSAFMLRTKHQTNWRPYSSPHTEHTPVSALHRLQRLCAASSSCRIISTATSGEQSGELTSS